MKSALTIAALGIAVAGSANAELSKEDFAKLAQNPVGNLVSVPFQNNTNFNTGPLNGTQNILNIQPVVPFELDPDWNLITRTILPLVWQPGFYPGQGSRFGLGDLQLSGFVSPSRPGPNGLIWGAGAIVQMPTDSNGLGNKNWGMGPTVVVLHLKPSDPWVYGALANNVWSLSRSQHGGAYNNLLLQQPFLNYNFAGGTYISSAPIITANWKAENSKRWTIPRGLGVGHIFHLGKLPVYTQIGGYYNVVRPDAGPNWHENNHAHRPFHPERRRRIRR